MGNLVIRLSLNIYQGFDELNPRFKFVRTLPQMFQNDYFISKGIEICYLEDHFMGLLVEESL